MDRLHPVHPIFTTIKFDNNDWMEKHFFFSVTIETSMQFIVKNAFSGIHSTDPSSNRLNPFINSTNLHNPIHKRKEKFEYEPYQHSLFSVGSWHQFLTGVFNTSL